MFGCASFIGLDPKQYANSFHWLHKNAQLTKQDDCPTCTPHNFKLANIKTQNYNEIKTFATLPALLKGYLRLGAKIASHGAIDYKFGSLDVLVILKVKDISKKYLDYYAKDSKRFNVTLKAKT